MERGTAAAPRAESIGPPKADGHRNNHGVFLTTDGEPTLEDNRSHQSCRAIGLGF
jgi:hypothetical protein